ncbi:MAG: radical SAM protein [Candidatus Altiarchaeales archaeon]|nr:radical SAM protein [Candidatus Altiarchaeales archaeon]MBD3417074.1 radical SAM protein [Candidatus Altiarchaeales archaeon]
MKVLLANLPWISDSEKVGLRAGSRWPHLKLKKEQLPYYPFPFFLAYAAAVLREGGHEVLIKDCIAEEMTDVEFLEYMKNESADVAVFETSTPSIGNDLMWTSKAKELGSKTVLTGPHATAKGEELLREEYVDFIITYEYEYPLLELVNALGVDGDFTEIKSLGFKEGGKPVVNGKAPLADVDEMPYPLREELPMEKYIDPFCKHAPNAQMWSSRGCPYQCTYCLEPWVFYGMRSYRARSPESVVDEMQYLVESYGAREIYFDDSSFSVDQERVRSICGEIVKRGLKVYWSCMADAKLTEETLRAMKEAGCIAIKFGVESADPRILDNINKHVNLSEVRRVVQLLKRIGIESHATYMFGLPGETRETMEKTLKFAFSLGTDTAQFSMAIPYPGTKFYEQAEREGWLKAGDWSDFTGQNPVIEYPNLSGAEIAETMHKARKRIMLKVALNPRQNIQYLKMIYGYGGAKAVLDNIIEKTSYLLKGG